jgi:hypothetical protein
MGNIFERLAYQATDAVTNKITSKIDSSVLKYTSAARDLLGGNLNGAANKIADNIFGRTNAFNGGSGGNIVLAGQSWSTVLQMYEEAAAVNRERTNLWHIGIDPVGKISAPRVNLLSTEVTYNSVQLGWEPIKIGSGFTLAPTGNDPVELRIVCYDADGEIKSWFDELQAVATPKDGSFAVPSDYVNTIKITHGAVEESRGYSKSWVMVPVSCEVNLSRSTDEFTALNLTFTQHDSFGAL